MKELRIVLLDVDEFTHGRKIANYIEASLYKSLEDALNHINQPVHTGINIYHPTTFMEACNNQEINLEDYWVSYIFIEQTDPTPEWITNV